MRQRITFLTRFKIYAIVLVVFVLLFGFMGVVLGASHTCASLEGNPSWQGADTINCAITYTDPIGGSDLAVCQYRVLSNGVETLGWTDAIPIENCDGSSVTLQTNDINVGIAQHCKDNGEDTCKIEFYVEDGAGNMGEDKIALLDIDYDPPQTSIVPNGSSWTKDNVDFILSCSDSESGCLPTSLTPDFGGAEFIVSCQESDLVSVGISGIVSCVDNGVCEEQVCFRSVDAVGNIENLKSSSVFQIDKKNPEILSFDVIPKKSAGLWVNADNPDVTIDWHVKDVAPNSGLQEVQVWRSANGGISWGQISGSPFAAPSSDWTSSATDSPADGTYLYGIHVKDKAENEITQSDAGFSPIEVQVDKTVPAITCTNGGNFENGTIVTVTCDFVDSPDGGAIYYTIDGTNPDDTSILYDPSSKPSFNGSSGDITFRALGYDEAGNPSSIIQRIYDFGDPPNVTIINKPPDPDNNAAPTFTFTVSGSSSSQCKIEPASYADCNSPHTISPALSDGEHTFRVQASNSFGSDTSSYTWTVDITAPTVTSFTINESISFPGTFNANSTFSIEWGDIDTGGSGINHREVWIGQDTTGDDNPDSWNPLDTNATSPITHNPADGTYWYGIHVIDNAGNCIDEAGSHDCGGVFSDSLDSRTVRGPINVVMLHNQQPNVPTGLLPADGSFTNNSSPSLSFSLSDPDVGDTVQYQIQIDDTSGFSSLLVDYTSSLAAQPSSRSFIVGQTAGSGSYTVGSPGQTLLDGPYFWRVKAIDNLEAQSGFATANGGSIAFLVDTIVPTILDFDVNPKPPPWVNQAAPDVTISWHVKDDGASDSGLKEVQVWQSSNGGVDWAQILGSPFAAPSNDWTGSTTDSPVSGDYLYGIHVKDNAGNERTETEAGFSTIAVQVDKQNPSTAIIDPDPVNWFNDDFSTTFNDADGLPGDSGLASSCEYEFFGDNPSGPDTSSGTLSRACGSDTKNITVGPSPAICLFEGQSSCGVSNRAFDNAGNDSGWQTTLFSIDFTEPLVGIVSPTLVQVGVPIEFTADLQDPVGRVTGCSFYSNPPDWTAHDASFTPVPCENGADCTVSATYTFAGAGDYQSGFRCQDVAGNLSVWNLTDVQAESLSVTLSADPAAGSINTKFNLSSQVTGSATGNANFKFDCSNDGVWEYEINNIDLSVSDPGWVIRQGEQTKVTAPDTFAVKDLCQYSSPDIYTANSLVERGISSAQDSLLINIGVNDNPEATDLQDNNSSADYCFVSAPPLTLSWTFSDVNPGDNQSAYQVQVATNPGFGSPIIDTGKVLSGNSEYSPPSLSFATTYFWRVRVWDSLDNVSPWVEGVAFTTPVHAYPFSDFTWIPVFPLLEEEIQFQDETVFALGSFNQSWLWSFGDGTTSSQQNPVHMYEENGVYLVGLRSSDDAGSCGGQSDIDGDGIPNEVDPDIDGDGILNEDDPDMDGDGILNEDDPDMDGDGLPNEVDPDMDGDGLPNEVDPDVDGDGIPNEQDPDIDGDGILNGEDSSPSGAQGDIDGDGIPNEQDPDIDGDGILNEQDPDIDGDGIPNEQDSSPSGQSSSGQGGQGTGGSGESIINVTLPLPEWQEISPF